MPVEYQTYTFDDTPSGRSKMNSTIQQMATQGWKVHSKETSQQGYGASKTCCLGCIFLPLALLGKKNNQITVIFERDTEAVTPTTPPTTPQPATPAPKQIATPTPAKKPTPATTKPKAKPKRKV